MFKIRCQTASLVCVFSLSSLAVSLPSVADSPSTLDYPLAPKLSAASAFQFGPRPRLEDAVIRAGLDDLRDGISWRQVETSPGVYDFLGASTAPIHRLLEKGLLGSLTVYPTNPLYDEGNTVHSDQAIEAFAAFAAAIARTYPQLPAIELANEFNSTSFVKGPAKQMTGLERADLYARYLKAFSAYPELRSIKILGGAAHSLPGAFLQRIAEQSPFGIMDAFTVHPYTTDPEQLPSQISVLRRIKGLEDLELEVTEFGTNERRKASDYFWKSYCAMALAGVDRAIWYPMENRNDGYEPIFSPQGALTALGQAFFLVREKYAQKPVSGFRPDPFTYGCVFDDQLAVIWGAKRNIEILGNNLRVADAELRTIGGGKQLSLDPERVILVQAPEGEKLDPWEEIAFGPNGIVADSFDQFVLPAEGKGADATPGNGFSRFLNVGSQTLPLLTCGGQDNATSPWTPYLCSDVVKRFVLGPRMFVLGGNKENPVRLTHRYVASVAGKLTLEIDLTVLEASQDGVKLTVLLDGATISDITVTKSERLDFTDIDIKEGSALDVTVSPGGNPVGDSGRIRIRLLEQTGRIFPADNG